MASILDNFRGNQTNAPSVYTFTIQYGTERVYAEVRPDDPSSPTSLDAALKIYASALGFDFSRPVSWRHGSQNVSGSTRPERGETYVMSVTHEQKGC